MNKAADLQDILQRAGSTVSSGLHDAGSSIKDWYSNMDPAAKKAIMRGLIGAGIGGAATGGMAMATPRDPEEKHHVMGPALLGALLGGTASAGIPYGLDLLRGNASIKGLVDRKPVGSRGMDMLGYPITHHPGLTAGTVLGAIAMLRARPATAALAAPAVAVRNFSAPTVALIQRILGKLGKGTLSATSRIGIGRTSGYASSAFRPMEQYGADLKKMFNTAMSGTLPPTLDNIKANEKAMSLGRRALGGKLGLPVGIGAGALADKYMGGDY